MANLKELCGSIKKGVVKHSPEILTGIGIAGMITTTILAVKATPKALDLINDIKEEHAEKYIEENKKELSKDIIKTVAPVYIPAVVTCGLSVACIIGATKVNSRRNAALATAYSLSETALREYQNKVVETIGERKEQAIKDSIAKDKMTNDPVSNKEVIITSNGNTLCYDSISGRYFMSDIEKLKSIENALNKKMMSDMYISLNELYYEMGLRCTEQGNSLGFNIEDGLIDFDFSAQIADDGRPCIVLGYRNAPKYEFRGY